MNTLIAAAVMTGLLAGAPVMAQTNKPAIVLVHGAFADTSSWNGVIKVLEKDGYFVIAAANPMRSLKTDAAYIADLIASVPSPVVLVGHSYGGSVISEAAAGADNVKALVFVAGFAPEAGETALGLSGKFPGSTLGSTLATPVVLSEGGNDLYIQQEKYRDQFAADVSASEAAAMAVGQRPVTEAAINEESGEPAWKTIPSWFVYGDKDKSIPPQTLLFMAERAHSKQTVVVKGASHVVMVSNPKPVAKVIASAASGL